MSLTALVSKLLSSSAKLSATEKARLNLRRQTPTADLQRPADQIRWVVADVETSGLNIATDRLLAIGAVAVVNGMVDVADSFEVVVQQSTVSSSDNILIHRISGETQRCGVMPVEALLRFIDYVGESPLVGYHAKFDEIMVARAYKQWLGVALHQQWLDLAQLAPALIAAGQLSREAILQGHRARALEWWLDYFQIKIQQRHHAAADALATAQLLAALLKHSTQRTHRTDTSPTTAKTHFLLAEEYAWTINQRQF